MRDFEGSTALTRRENEIALAYAAGSTYRVIAAELHIAPATVRKHLGAIYRKLGVGSKISLLRKLETGGTGGTAPPEGLPRVFLDTFVCGHATETEFASLLAAEVRARLARLAGLRVTAWTG